MDRQDSVGSNPDDGLKAKIDAAWRRARDDQ